MRPGSTAIAGAVGLPGSVYSARGAQREADDPADREQAVARDRELEHEQHDREPDQQQAADVERQAAEADEREDDRDRAQMPVTKFGFWSSNSRP